MTQQLQPIATAKQPAVLPTAHPFPTWLAQADVCSCRVLHQGRPYRVGRADDEHAILFQASTWPAFTAAALSDVLLDLSHVPTRAVLLRELAAQRTWDGWWSFVKPEIAPDDVQARILYAALARLADPIDDITPLPRLVVWPWEMKGGVWYRYAAGLRGRPHHTGDTVAIVSEDERTFIWAPGWRMHLVRDQQTKRPEGPEVGAAGRALADQQLPALGALTAESLGWSPAW